LVYGTGTTSSSSSPAPILHTNLPYNRSKKRVKTEDLDREDDGPAVPKRANQKVDLGYSILRLTDELALTRKSKEEFQTVQQKAIGLLKTAYKKRLDILGFIEACDLLQDEGKAGTFVTLTNIERRDRWLEIILGRQLEPM
jgi:hypothetical protein